MPDINKRNQYLSHFGGLKNWMDWLDNQTHISDEMKKVAVRGVGQGYQKDWDEWEDWNRTELWKKRNQYPVQSWIPAAKSAGLPLNREEYWEAPSHAPGVVQKAADVMVAGAEIVPRLMGVPAVPEGGKDFVSQMLASIAGTASGSPVAGMTTPITDLLGEATAAAADNPELLSLMVYNRARADVRDTVDVLVPDAVGKFFTEGGPKIPVRLNSVKERKAWQDLGLPEYIPISPIGAMKMATGLTDQVMEEFEHKRLSAMREAGVSDTALKVIGGTAELIEIGASFAIAPDAAVLRIARAEKAINAYRATMKALPTAKDTFRLKKLVENLARAHAGRGGIVSETGKGLFVGFTTGEGDLWDKTKNAAAWGIFGGAFGGVASGFKYLMGRNSDIIWKEMVASGKYFTPQEVATINATSIAVERDAVDLVVSNVGRKLKPLPAKPVEEVPRPPEQMQVLIEHRQLLRQADEQGLPSDMFKVREVELAHPEIFGEVKPPPAYASGVVEGKTGQLFDLNVKDVTYSSSLDTAPEVGQQVLHKTPTATKSFGTGEITGKAGELYTIQFDKGGVRTLKANKAWSVKSGESVSGLTQNDKLRILVERDKVDPRKALIQMITQRLEANDPAARKETLQLMFHDLFYNPSGLNDATPAMLDVFEQYMVQPLGTHPGFRWDMVSIEQQIAQQGYARLFKLPYDAWDEAGKFVMAGGPKGIAFKQKYAIPGKIKDKGGIFSKHNAALKGEEGIAGISKKQKPVEGVERFDAEEARLLGRGTAHRPGETQYGEAYSEETLITSIQDKVAAKGHTVRMNEPPRPEADLYEAGPAGPPTLPHAEEDIMMVYPVKGYTGEKKFVGGEWRETADIGFTLEQELAHWEEASRELRDPNTWQMIRPEMPPTVYAEESANILNRYLKNIPAYPKVERFNPKQHNLAVLNGTVGDVHGVPAGIESPVELLDDVALAMGRPKEGLSLVQKGKDGKWTILEGPGESRSHELLVNEVAEEIGKIGASQEDSIVARNLRMQVSLGERVQEQVKSLQAVKAIDDEVLEAALKAGPVKKGTAPVKSPTDHILDTFGPRHKDRVSGLPDWEATEKAMMTDSAEAMTGTTGEGFAQSPGRPFTVAVADTTNVGALKEVLPLAEQEAVVKEAFNLIRKVADKHNIPAGRGRDNKVYLWGSDVNPETLQADLMNSFNDLAEKAPEIYKLLYNEKAPILLMPSVGTQTGKNLSYDALLSAANASATEMRTLQKAHMHVQGFFSGKNFAPLKKLDDGNFLLKDTRSGEELIILKDAPEEIWDHIAYAKLTSEGGRVLIRDKRFTVVKNGEVTYSTRKLEDITNIESHTQPLVDSDLTEAINLGSGGDDVFSTPLGGGLPPHQPEPLGQMGARPPNLRGRGQWGKYFVQKSRPVMEGIEKDYNIASSHWYDLLDRGHGQFHKWIGRKDRAFTNASKGLRNKKTLEVAGEFMLMRGEDQKSMFSRLPQKEQKLVTNMRPLFNDLWEKMGVPKKEWDNALSYLNAQKTGTLPRELAETEWMKNLNPVFTAYELDRSFNDIGGLYHKLWRAQLKREYLVPVSKFIRNELKEIPRTELPDGARKSVEHMTDTFLGAADGDFLAAIEAMGVMMEQVAAPETAHAIAQEFPRFLLSLQYSSSMAYRVGLPFRNLFQPMLTGGPLIGARDIAAGWKQALKNLRDQDRPFNNIYTGKMTIEDLYDLGIAHDYVPIAGTSILEDTASASAYTNLLMRETKRGLWMQKVTDQFNRRTVFYGSINKQTRYLKRALQEKKDFRWFASHADLDMYHEVNVKRWEGMWDKAMKGEGGENPWKELMIEVAKRATDDSQFVYAGYAQPRAFHYPLLKIGLQYGVWPVNYADLLWQRSFGATGIPLAAKAKFWRRWTSIHGGLAGVQAASGLKLAAWGGFEPLQYFGGPYAQLATSTLANLQSRREDKWERIEDDLNRMAVQSIPLGGLVRLDINKASQYLAKDDGIGALLSMFRLKDWPEDEGSTPTRYE